MTLLNRECADNGFIVTADERIWIFTGKRMMMEGRGCKERR
jgi:hypothetical protein